MREATRREYRRLLVNFALTYFDREIRVGELDRTALQQFVDWLTSRPGRDGRQRDDRPSSIAGASERPRETAPLHGKRERGRRRNRIARSRTLLR